MARLLYSTTGVRAAGAVKNNPEHVNPTGLPAFAFGENWKDFLAKLGGRSGALGETLDRTLRMLESLTLLPRSVEGKRVLDIGSGSGTMSCAAFLGGAREIQSIDVQEASVEATISLRRSLGIDSPSHWKVKRLNVLDPLFVKDFVGRFDVVISIGVLMHTGDVYGALRNAAQAVARGGLLIIDVYMFDQHEDHDAWLSWKQKYTSGSMTLGEKADMELGLALYYLLPALRAGLDPLEWMAKTYATKDFWVDMRDWCGGWPMEFMVASEFIEYADTQLGMEVVSSNGNFWVLMRKGDIVEPWRDALSARELHTLVEAAEGGIGHCGRARYSPDDDDVLATSMRVVWECKLDETLGMILDEALDFRARGRRLMLLRDGKPVGNLRNRRVTWPSLSSDALLSARVGFYELVAPKSSEESALVRFAISGDPQDAGEAARYAVAVIPAWADPFFYLSNF